MTSSRPTEPKSSSASPPSASSSTLPGCGSAWKTPSSITCRSSASSSVRASACRSSPRSAMTGPAAASGTPSSRSITSTPLGAQRPVRPRDPDAVPAGGRPRRPRPCWPPRPGSPAPPAAPTAKPSASSRTPIERPQDVLASSVPGQPVDDVEVPLDHRPMPGRCTLTHHPLAGRQPGGVHLGDRGGGQRLRLDRGEDLVDRPAELGGEHRLHLRPRRRRGLVLQPAQLVDELGRQQVAPGGQHLAELDEGDAALVQRRRQRPGQRGAARPGRRAPRHRPRSARPRPCRSAIRVICA